MSLKYLTDPESACKPARPDRVATSERPRGPLARFATLAGGGAVPGPDPGPRPCRGSKGRIKPCWRQRVRLRCEIPVAAMSAASLSLLSFAVASYPSVVSPSPFSLIAPSCQVNPKDHITCIL